MQNRTAAVGRLPTKKKRLKWDTTWTYVFACMPILGFMLFSLFPIIVSVIAMFTDINLYNLSEIDWNGFEGFKLVFSSAYSSLQTVNVHAYFVKSVGITLWITCAQFVSLAIALLISVLLAQKLRGSKVLQILFFIPYICSTVAVSLMWKWVFNDDNGLLNSLLGTHIDWIQNGKTVTWCVMAAIIWQAPGYGIVMYKAALGNANASLYEAASLDGANAFHKFRYVTLPAVAPTTFYLVMAGISAGFLTYDIAALVAPRGWGTSIGGKDNMALTIMRLVYYLIDDTTLADSRSYLSAAAIISWLLFLVTATLSIIVYRVRNRRLQDA